MATRGSRPPCRYILWALLDLLACACAIVVFADNYTGPLGGQLIILFACVHALVFVYVHEYVTRAEPVGQPARGADALMQSLLREEEKPEMTWDRAMDLLGE
jgi:hypothetical protein